MGSSMVYRIGIAVMSFSLLTLMIGITGGAWLKEGSVVLAEKYVGIPEDAKLSSVTRIYDNQYEQEVHFLHYRVSPPHDHRIMIKLGTSTGELLFYCDTSKLCTERVSTDVRVSLDEAKKTALDFIARVAVLPEGSRLTRAELLQSQSCGGRILYEYWFEWSRVIGGIEVIGENLRVAVHASSGEVIAYNRQWFGEPPSNTEIKVSEKDAVELGRKHLLEGLGNLTGPSAKQMVEATVKARVDEIKLAYIRSGLSMAKDGSSPKGLWLCWISRFTYANLPEDLKILEGKWSETYVQATTGEVILHNAAK